jgi:hypothetical protein
MVIPASIQVIVSHPVSVAHAAMLMKTMHRILQMNLCQPESTIHHLKREVTQVFHCDHSTFDTTLNNGAPAVLPKVLQF